MANQAVEQELVRLEKQYWQALKDKDAETALRLNDDPSTIVGAQGIMVLDREMFTGMMNDESWALRDFAVSDVQVRMLGDDVAIVTYKVTEDLTVEGKPVRL